MITLLLLLITLPVRPDPILTPGAVATTSRREVCTSGYAGAHRNVSAKTKLDVYRAYGIVPNGRFEVDHLISLQLGGSNDPSNLWPESYETPYNAYRKDELENRLHWRVCHGQMTLPDAQWLIRSDWITTYLRTLPSLLVRVPIPRQIA